MQSSSLLKIAQNRWLWALVIFGVLLALYVRTLMPGTVGGDAGELQYAGPILALTHPTGLPLYIFVGYVWAKIVDIGTVAYRMNLLAAVSAALACAITFWMNYRLYGRLVIGLACGLILGLGATFWGQAVLADKYAFNTLWVALVLGLALLWAREHEQPHGDKLLYILSGVYGISLLHHRTMLLFAFGLGFMVIYHEGWKVWQNKRRSLICLGLVTLPALIVYPLFLPWIQARNLAPSEWQPQTVGEWIEWLMDRDEAKEAFVTTGVGPMLESYGRTMLYDYTLIVLVIAVLGLVMMARRDFGSAFLLGFTYLIQGGLSANWRDNDRPFTYFLPSFILLVYAFGYGLNELWEWTKRQLATREVRWQPAASVVIAVLVAVVIGLQFRYAYPIRAEDADYGKPLGLWRTTVKTGDMGERLASGLDDLPRDAVLLTDWEQVTILWYYQKVERVRPDVTIDYPIEQRLDGYIASGREVCVSRNIPVGADWHPTAFDALVCLQPEPALVESLDELPARLTRLGTALLTPDNEPILELAGYSMEKAIYERGTFVPLVIAWRGLADIENDYSIALFIMHDDWREFSKEDIQNPVTGMYPTSRWVRNELVQDYYELDLKPDMPPGNYFWAVTVYRPLQDGNFEKLHDESGGEVIFGGSFQVVAEQ